MKTGWSLREIRQRRGLTLDELSALCGVSRDDLGLYDRSQMTPRPGTVEKIARALDVPIVEIRQGMGWTASEPAETWESPEGGDPLRAGVLEALQDVCGAEFTPREEDIRALMESVKASIPALVEHMKDVRPEAEIHGQLLKELDAGGSQEPEALIRRYALTDGQWARICPLLPPENAGRGRAFKSNRLMLDGILYWMKSGANWKDLPERFGRHKCVSDRLRLWVRTGVWQPVLRELLALHILEEDDVPASLREEAGENPSQK